MSCRLGDCRDAPADSVGDLITNAVGDAASAAIGLPAQLASALEAATFGAVGGTGTSAMHRPAAVPRAQLRELERAISRRELARSRAVSRSTAQSASTARSNGTARSVTTSSATSYDSRGLRGQARLSTML